MINLKNTNESKRLPDETLWRNQDSKIERDESKGNTRRQTQDDKSNKLIASKLRIQNHMKEQKMLLRRIPK
jgi:hypothetical protein